MKPTSDTDKLAKELFPDVDFSELELRKINKLLKPFIEPDEDPPDKAA